MYYQISQSVDSVCSSNEYPSTKWREDSVLALAPIV